MDCVAPGVSVSGDVRPLLAVYVTHTERLLEAVFVAFLRCPCHDGQWRVQHRRPP